MKIIKILIVLFFLILITSQNVFALSNIFDTGLNWTDTGSEHKYMTMDTKKLQETSDSLYNVLLVAAIAIALIVGAILGISYMTAGISSKAEVKQSLFPYIVSCIIVFGSFGIWKLAVTTINSFQPTEESQTIQQNTP